MRQHGLKKTGGMGNSGFSHIFRRTFGNDLASTVAPFRTQIHNPVCRLDDIQVVLNNHNGIAVVTQGVQYVQQLLDIVEVQTGCRSSRIYSVLPVSRLESSRASFTRCASPPDRVVAAWPRRM